MSEGVIAKKSQTLKKTTGLVSINNLAEANPVESNNRNQVNNPGENSVSKSHSFIDEKLFS